MDTLHEVADGVWSQAQPHSLYGIQLGTRMNVVRLPDSSLWVHSPIALTEPIKAELASLGRVSHVVLPNLFHHLYAASWQREYPDATTHAPAALRRKRNDLRVDVSLSATPHPDWGDTLVPHPIDGCMLDETVFVHAASKTVISVDLTENFETSPHWPTRQYLKLAGLHGRVGWSRLLRPLYRDRRAARRSIDALLEHDFDRVLLAHGDPIETDGRRLVRQTFEGWLR